MVEAATTPCSRLQSLSKRRFRATQYACVVPPTRLYNGFSRKGVASSGWSRRQGLGRQCEARDAAVVGSSPHADWCVAAPAARCTAWLTARSANAGDMDVFQSVEGPDSIYPDGLTSEEALKQLDQLAQDRSKPFFLAVGIIRPHLPFGAPAKYFEPYRDVELPPTPHPEKPQGKTTWHGSGEFMKYNRWKRNPNSDAAFAVEVRKHYAACVSYADAQVGRLLSKLDEVGAARIRSSYCGGIMVGISANMRSGESALCLKSRCVRR